MIPRKALQDHVDSEDKGVTKRDTLGGAGDHGDRLFPKLEMPAFV